ncbi:tRNA (adenosine(37)-N6)-dimethylallyltransferase MiaA [Chloroflexota bacterium]
MNKIVAIVGPTGIGKSRMAILLAHNFDIEIISADSRQVYCYMDIGTAKPEKRYLSGVPHHLINIINPDDAFGLAQYKELAIKAIETSWQRGRLPLLVGGSGQYAWSLLEDWGIPSVPPDPDFRQSLEARAAKDGGEEIFHELEQHDPVAAARIDRRNIRRVIRALEVSRSLSLKPKRTKAAYDSLIIGLTADRKELYRMIDKRVDRMMDNGLVEEVKRLIGRGYRLDLPAMSSIGYRQIGEYLEGKTNLEAAVQQIKFESHRFVRQQYNWFSLKNDRIRWFDIQLNPIADIIELIEGFTGRVTDKKL